MIRTHYRDLAFETIDEISDVKALPQITAVFASAMTKFGFTAWGINGLPPPGEDADPSILTESTPKGFRDLYTYERFYLVDHICAHARAMYEPFRYSEAPFDRAESERHERFMQALDAFEMGKGLIVPLGRPTNIPACVWLAGQNPDLTADSARAAQLITLFAATKAYAVSRPAMDAQPSKLTAREREVLQWTSAGKTSWEISVISGLSERAINKIMADAMVKLDAVTRAQAAVNAIRTGEIEL